MIMETPCIVLDMDRVERNLRRMQEICQANHCKLRPHTDRKSVV